MYQHLLKSLISIEHVSAKVSAVGAKDVVCQHCGGAFHYFFRCVDEQKGSSVYGIQIDKVTDRATRSAAAVAGARVRAGVAPVACPKCGKLQEQMVLQLRRQIVARSQPLGWVLPAVLAGMDVCIVLLASNFMEEPIPTRWAVGAIAIAAIALALFVQIGLRAWLESRTVSFNHFGHAYVPKGISGRAPDAAVQIEDVAIKTRTQHF